MGDRSATENWNPTPASPFIFVGVTLWGKMNILLLDKSLMMIIFTELDKQL